MFEDSVESSIPSIWASMNSWFTPGVLFVLLNVMIGTIALTSNLANQKHHHQQQNDDAQQQQQQQRTGLARAPSVLQRLKSINFSSYYTSQEPHHHHHHSPSPPTAAADFNPNSDSDAHFPPERKTETHNFFHQTLPNPDSDTHFAPEQNIETHTFFQQSHFEEDPNPDSDTHFASEQTHETQTTHFGDDEQPTMDEVYSQLKDRHVTHVNRTNSDTKPSGGVMPERLPAKMRKSASAKSVFGHFEEDDVVEARRPATVREGKTEGDDDGCVDAKADDFINKFKQQLKLQRLDSIIRSKDMISGRGGK